MLLQADSYRTYLGDELIRRIRENSRYSLRAFAKQLKLSPGELSEILRGKRRLTLKAAHRISNAMNLTEVESSHLLSLIQKEEVNALDTMPLPKSSLSLDLFSIISDWYHFAILNLVDCDDFRSNERWISSRLGISLAEVGMALNRLERVGLIVRKAGKISAVKDYVLSPEGIPSEAIKHYHRQILQKALHALDLQSVEERDFSGLTFPMNPKFLNALKKEIAQFVDKVGPKYAKGSHKSEVYHLEVLLFRLTRSVAAGGNL